MDPLSPLRDIQLPEAIGPWPLAVGWYCLIFFSLVLLGGLLMLGYRYWRLAKPRREMLSKLALLKKQYQCDEDKVSIAIELSSLLRRAVLSKFPRSEVASLQQEAWLLFLDETGKTQDFTRGPGRALVTAPYQPNCDYPVDALFQVITNWTNSAMKNAAR